MNPIRDLVSIVGDAGLLTDEGAMAPYSRDWRGMFHGRPLAVASPRSTDEVAAIVRLCQQHGIAIVPAGGRTGLAGGATPDDSGNQLVLALDRMNAIRDVDALGETITLGAGCILATAQAAAAELGLMLPISLASEGSVQIGGAIATNAGGTNVLRYGMARARVLGLEVVLADGTVLNGLRALRKDNAGLDWKHWFVGSEGALGIITAAVLQLVPATPHASTALLGFASCDDALDGLRHLRARLGDSITGFELMARAAVDRAAALLGTASPLPDQPWLVLAEARSALAAIEQEMPDACMALIEREIIADALLASSGAQAQALWRLRESLAEAEAHAGRSLKHDISVPIARLAAFVAEAEAMIGAGWPAVALNIFGHAGDGNLHYNVIYQDDADIIGLSAAVHDLVTGYDGSISAEHGIGQYRVEELSRLTDPAELALMAQIKRLFDPSGILNPGRVIPLASA
jgi:FAD/FMN-containing dehydrogenase